ncbi:MAG: redoxin family protein [Nitrososphaerales archaeon]
MDVIPATPASDFMGVEGWENTQPLSLKSLKGKVVLLDCWTYTCIFCLRSIPIMRRLDEKYSKHGLVVVGAHSAEYSFAVNSSNIKKALARYRVNFPTALDTKNKTWEAYGNMYWPKHILIDVNGFIRYERVGYGSIAEFEEPIIELLQEAGYNPPTELDEKDPYDEIYDMHGMHFVGISPEICVGYTRMRRFGNNHSAEPNKVNQFKDSKTHVENAVYLHGSWFWDRECVKYSGKDGKNAAVVMNYNAKRVNTIIGTTDGKPARIEIKLDGNYLTKENAGHDVNLKDGISYVDVTWDFVHNLVKTENPETHEVEIIPKTSNFVFYTFVFG